MVINGPVNSSSFVRHVSNKYGQMEAVVDHK